MTRRIFRASALQQYNNRLDKIALLRYASLPWLLILWLCCGLLLLCVALLWAAQMPVYASGPGVVIVAPPEITGAGEAVVAAFLPAEFADELQTQQRAIVQFEGATIEVLAGERLSQVAAFAAEVLTPTVARARYGLDSSTGLLVNQPVVVALILLESSSSHWLGSVSEVKIEIGTQRALALLPGVGRFFALP